MKMRSLNIGGRDEAVLYSDKKEWILSNDLYTRYSWDYKCLKVADI